LIFNFVEVEDLTLSDRSILIGIQHSRPRNILQKFKSINPLYKDNINTKVFTIVVERSSVVFLVSILRCVICFVRRSRRIESSSIAKKGYSRNRRRSKSHSHGSDDQVKKEQLSESESISSTVIAPEIFSLEIETMVVETINKAPHNNSKRPL
jgi:hypothetical protein